MTNIWPKYGFSQSLYDTNPIPATYDGSNLLVGRSNELDWLKSCLASTSLHPTIEGGNGVGKTSLVAVAGYRLRKAFVDGNTSQALIPLNRVFQLDPNGSVDAFRRQVLLEAAQGMIDNFEILRRGGLAVPDVNDMRKWLTRAVQKNKGGGISVLAAGASASWGETVNDAAGFSEAGFSTIVETWLRTTFPNVQSGGFICVIDNLELLETYQVARKVLEALRDEVLGLPGLRWVLCGSRGIVLTAASSPRLEGRLSEPMVVGSLPRML